MKLLGRTQMLSQYPLLESLEVIKGLGFDGAEICVERKDWSLHPLSTFPVQKVRERAADLNLNPYSFSLHQDYIHDDALFEMTKEAIAMTPALGTGLFVFGGARKQSGDEDEWSRMVERTRALVAVAEVHDVVLAKEFEPDFIVGTTRELLRLFDQIPSPNLAANVDLGHVFLCDPDPLQALRRLGNKIVHCHISNMPADEHDHLVPQEGDMDLRAYLRTLAELGFDGGMALDLYKYDYEVVAKSSIAYLRGLMGDLA